MHTRTQPPRCLTPVAGTAGTTRPSTGSTTWTHGSSPRTTGAVRGPLSRSGPAPYTPPLRPVTWSNGTAPHSLSGRFTSPCFLQQGQDNALSEDGFVYMYLLRQIFLLILSPFRFRDICPGAGTCTSPLPRTARLVSAAAPVASSFEASKSRGRLVQQRRHAARPRPARRPAQLRRMGGGREPPRHRWHLSCILFRVAALLLLTG